MPKRSGKPAADPNRAAHDVVAKLTGTAPKRPTSAKKNPHAVALGRKGGKIGGKARARNLTPEQLAEIGRQGAAKRWGLKLEK